VICVLPGTANTFAERGSCDRAGLKNVLDLYFGAVIRHGPAPAPLFVGFRQTENTTSYLPALAHGKTLTGLGMV
jgi:hypothetical protein